MPPRPLAEEEVRDLCRPEVLERGRTLRRQRAVLACIRRGDALAAFVQGSEEAPYHVRIPLAEGERGEAFCTCPYEWGGWCKHAVAVALYAADDPEGLDVRPPLAETLAAQHPGVLMDLLLNLAAADPVLAWRIEQHLDPDQAMPNWEEGYWG